MQIRRTRLVHVAIAISVFAGTIVAGAGSSGAAGDITTPARTDLVRWVSYTVSNNWRFDYYRNLAYPCAISGYQTFLIGRKVGSSSTAAKPLWVKMHGGGIGFFDDAGNPRPSAGQKTEETSAQLLQHNDGGLMSLARAAPQGFRLLLVSMCSHDLYAGVNTADPHNPNLAAGKPRTTNGLLATKAAISYTRSQYPTTDFLLHGGSAGGAGTLHVAWALQRQGSRPDGIISDSGLINQEAERARIEQGICADASTQDSLTRAAARWHPTVSDPANQPDLLVSRGALTVPIMHVWSKGDRNTCGDTPMTCPLRDGSTPTLWSATCGHTPMSLAIAALPATRHSKSMGLCVEGTTTDTDPCDRHVVTTTRSLRNTDAAYPADYIPTIMTWAKARLLDD